MIKTYYLPDGKVFKGDTHKIGSRVMTGAKHTASSMTLTPKPPKKAKK